jgi:hypothetical protein
LYYASKANNSAIDPDDLSFADQDTLPTKLNRLMAVDGIYSLVVVRQSGNVERVVENLVAAEVLLKISQTMRKAKIDTVSIKDTGNAIQLYRVMHNARGRQEGKRIGGFNILQTGWGSEAVEDDSSCIDFASTQSVEVSPQSEAEKAIIKAFFRAAEGTDSDMLPTAILNSFDGETGEGNDAFHYNTVLKMLIYADLYLLGKGKMTEEIRSQFLKSDREWQRNLGKDYSMKTVLGIHAFGSTSPSEIKQAYESLWKKCERAISANEVSSFGATAAMAIQRPKILDRDF